MNMYVYPFVIGPLSVLIYYGISSTSSEEKAKIEAQFKQASETARAKIESLDHHRNGNV